MGFQVGISGLSFEGLAHLSLSFFLVLRGVGAGTLIELGNLVVPDLHEGWPGVSGAFPCFSFLLVGYKEHVFGSNGQTSASVHLN